MDKREYVTIIEEAVLNGDVAEIAAIIKKKSSLSAGTKDILAALSGGIESARNKLHEGVISIPEFLLSIDAFKEGMSRVKSGVAGGVPVFIGVVEGDVHDLGKNIVAAVLSASGYAVTDMGKDVTRDHVRRYIDGRKKAVVALSSMMSTSFGAMKEIISWLGETAPGIKTMVGGASLDLKIAKSMGADGYAESAVTAPEEMKRLCKAFKQNENKY